MKKLLVIGIIVLFIGLAFIPSFNAVSISMSDYTTLPIIDFTNEMPSYRQSDCEQCINECDMELAKIIPYYGRGVLLTFSCKIKNIGNYSCSGSYGFNVKAYLWKTKMLIDEYSYILNGVVDKGEERDFSGNSIGIYFEARALPRFYRLRFRAFPDDSNMENNYLEAIYIVWGLYDFNQNYKLIKTYRPVYTVNEV